MPMELAAPADGDWARLERIARAEPVLDEGAADLRRAIAEHSDEVRAVRIGGDIAGCVQLAPGDTAFVYAYIAPDMRRRGIGAQAVRMAERLATVQDTRRIMTIYRASDAAMAAFAGHMGYARGFSSAYMRYDGGPVAVRAERVQQYSDADYDAAHDLYARAFHLMRVSVGDFPDSVPEPPSAGMRRYWARTADERFVLADDADRPVGYAHVEGSEIGSISIAPGLQGRGLGRAFLGRLMNDILARGGGYVTLYCVTGNRARALYDGIGFKEQFTAVYAHKTIAR